MKGEQAIRRLVRFLSPEITGEAVSLFRLAFGLLSLWTAFAVWLSSERYFSDRGLLPWELVRSWDWAKVSLLALAPHSQWLLELLVVLLALASCGLLLGVLPRLCAFAIFAIHVSLHHRNPYIFNSGDRLFLMFAGLAVFLPLEAHAALLPWRARSGRAPRAGEVPRRVFSGWVQRLMQLQICHVYWYSCFAKVRHASWIQGRAMQDVLSSPLFSEWPTNLSFLPSALLSWSTLLFELAFPILVWHRRARPFVLALGVLFHFGIDLLMVIPMFSAMMVVSYTLFLRDDEAERALAFFRRTRVRSESVSAQSP